MVSDSNEIELKLVKSLSKGNILAFNTLFKEYASRLYRFAYGYLKSEDEAEELVQEVFRIVWEKREELKEELSFKSYLFTISFNMIRKHFRTKAQLSAYLHSGLKEEADMQTSRDINYNSLLRHIINLVNRLPEKRRLIFMKSRLEGLSIREIADELKISHKTVENQLTDALRFLRTNLNRENLAVFLFFVFFIS